MLDLTREVVESRGWRYEIATEPPQIRFMNIRFLAGYRREWLFNTTTLDKIRRSTLNESELSIGDIVSRTECSKPA
jgi:hypothetical protein